jgi:hypothetical protein
MASASISLVRNSEFDTFLFAPVGKQRNGMALRALHALARLDVDPWREAESLRRLSAHAATERLTSLLSSLAKRATPPLAPVTIARLIGLLPQTVRDNIWTRKTPLTGANHSWPLMLYFAVAFVTMCAEQMLERRDAEAPTSDASRPWQGASIA